MELSNSVLSTHSCMFSKLYLPFVCYKWQYGNSLLFTSHVHYPKGSFLWYAAEATFLHVIANLSSYPHELVPVKYLQADMLASIIGFPAFCYKAQLGPSSITSKFADFPFRTQFKVDLHPNLCESAA